MNDINNMSIGEFLSNNDDEKYIAKDIVDDEYIMLHQLYKTAFSDYLLSNSSLKEYKSLLKNEGLLPVPEDEKKYYQKNDCLGLQYIYLRSDMHVERLIEKQQKVLLDSYKNNDITNDEIMRIVEESYKRVVPINPDEPSRIYEPERTIHGDYRVRGDDIVFCVKTYPKFDDKDDVDMDEEQHRIDLTYMLASKMMQELAKELDCHVTVIPEVF